MANGNLSTFVYIDNFSSEPGVCSCELNKNVRLEVVIVGYQQLSAVNLIEPVLQLTFWLSTIV